ncbi:MAG: hypothetical protein A2161_13560 [Candidatus Schekmanbacteria bacterium RBG_13_48_7]|uniref:Response regulatory domain-containing protein n=1 Tax=Candidatus Schekmanbacteria bacterium RBG_13_48_7 TaxID=1817878 RepID=A0A1F7RU20_9BACT|nr:MAG: hypothetical protein A2161_13560 [Candidatus Schekmanbacteria bacterium RBG_13_48_7]
MKKKKYHILIVDDDRQLRIALEKVLIKSGYAISTAPNGIEAWEMVAEKDFDLVISDIRMPEKGGIELLSNIKKYKPNIPVIVMTAFGEPLSYHQAIENGAREYIHKPIKKDDMLKIVHHILNEGAAI